MITSRWFQFSLLKLTILSISLIGSYPLSPYISEDVPQTTAVTSGPFNRPDQWYQRNPLRRQALRWCLLPECKACLKSCNYLKYSERIKNLPLTQYLYLQVCAQGCKTAISCLGQNYCLPVLQENPDYFIYCANTCPLEELIDLVFID